MNRSIVLLQATQSFTRTFTAPVFTAFKQLPVNQSLHQTFEQSNNQSLSQLSKCASNTCGHNHHQSINQLFQVNAFDMEITDDSAMIQSINQPLSSINESIKQSVDLPSMDQSVDIIECAVPKRKTSPSRQRHRRAGQRMTGITRRYSNYRVCLNCGSPVKPHFLCQ